MWISQIDYYIQSDCASLIADSAQPLNNFRVIAKLTPKILNIYQRDYLEYFVVRDFSKVWIFH